MSYLKGSPKLLSIIVFLFFILSFLIDPLSGMLWKITFFFSFIISFLDKNIGKKFFLILPFTLVPFLLTVLRSFLSDTDMFYFELKYPIYFFIVWNLYHSKFLNIYNCSLLYVRSLSLLILLSAILYATGIYTPFYDGRFSCFNSPNSFSFFLLLGLTCLYFLNNLRISEKSLITSLFVLSILISDSRNAYFSCIIILSLQIIYSLYKKRRFLFSTSLLIALLISPILLNSLSLFKSRLDLTKYLGISMPKISNNSHFKINIAKDNFSHNNPYSEEELERRVFNGRKTIWTVAFNLFLDNPNIGIGKRNFSKNYNEHIKNNLDNYTREYNLTKDEIPFDTIVRDPHNLVLGLLCDYGVFFTLFVLLTFFLAFTFVFRFNFYLTFLFFCFFLNGITNYHIYRPVLETVFAFSLILIFSQNRGFSFFNKIEFHKIFLKMKNLEQ